MADELSHDTLESRLKALRRNLDNPPSSDNRVDPLKVTRAKIFRTTAGALIAACQNNPDHPVALAFRKGMKGLKDNTEVNVHQVDVEALLDDKDVIMEEMPEVGADDEGDITRIVVTKKVGDKRKKVENAKAPSHAVTEVREIMQDAELARHQREAPLASSPSPSTTTSTTTSPPTTTSMPSGRPSNIDKSDSGK